MERRSKSADQRSAKSLTFHPAVFAGRSEKGNSTMNSKRLVAPTNDPPVQDLFNCCRQILTACHSPDGIDDSFVYLLCNDGSLQLGLGKKKFLTGHFGQQADSLGWKLSDLPVCIPKGYGPASAVIVDKRTALGLRSTLHLALASIADAFDAGHLPEQPNDVSDPVTKDSSLYDKRTDKSSKDPLENMGNPFAGFTTVDQEKCIRIYASAYKAAQRWPFDPDEIAHYALAKALAKFSEIYAPASFGWRTASRYCWSLSNRAKSRPLHDSYEESARTYGPDFDELLGPILQLQDPLDSWLLCSKMLTDLPMKEITRLTNFFSPRYRSESYYRQRMHAAIETLDLC